MIELSQLEANVVLHCNKRCVNCSHAAPWHKPYYMTLEVFAHDLALLMDKLHAKTFLLMGGEPTLHPALPDLLWAGRMSHIADEVGVNTNGVGMGDLPESFWAALQVMRLSIYPDADKDVLDLPIAKAKEYGFKFHHHYYTEFKHQGGSFTRHHCQTRCPAFHEGKFYMCPQSLTFPGRFMGLPDDIDGFPLDDCTEESLRCFIEHTPEMRTCAICCGDQFFAPWKQASSEEEWRQLSGL